MKDDFTIKKISAGRFNSKNIFTFMLFNPQIGTTIYDE